MRSAKAAKQVRDGGAPQRLHVRDLLADREAEQGGEKTCTRNRMSLSLVTRRTRRAQLQVVCPVVSSVYFMLPFVHACGHARAFARVHSTGSVGGHGCG